MSLIPYTSLARWRRRAWVLMQRSPRSLRLSRSHSLMHSHVLRRWILVGLSVSEFGGRLDEISGRCSLCFWGLEMLVAVVRYLPCCTLEESNIKSCVNRIKLYSSCTMIDDVHIVSIHEDNKYMHTRKEGPQRRGLLRACSRFSPTTKRIRKVATALEYNRSAHPPLPTLRPLLSS